MWATITKPFAWLLLQFYDWTGNYGVSIILFALVINLILAPFMAKSKKSMMRTSRIQPRIQELQRRHEGNQQKLNEEMSKLYREEHINPMSGCLWSLIPFPILIALYSVIRQPLTRMMYLAQDTVTVITDYIVKMGWYVLPAKTDAYAEIKIAEAVHQHWGDVQTALAGKVDGLMNIDFSFIGLNLGDMPNWKFFSSCDWSDTSSWLPALGLFLIPIISAFLSWLSMKVSNMANPPDPKTQAQMKSMNIVMPLMSIWICFVMPAALGVYWIANSIFGMVRDYSLTVLYKKQLDKEDAEKLTQRSQREKELEEKRLETERLKAEGRTATNPNTNKKKLQAKEKQAEEERRAAAERAEREAARARKGIKGNEAPASQVGNRRYARGRAYDPERFGAENAPKDEETNTVDADEAEKTVIVAADEEAVSAPADSMENTEQSEDSEEAEETEEVEEAAEDEDSDM